MSIHNGVIPAELAALLTSRCDQCFGLCCVALYFSPTDGFPVEKSAGSPCPNLGADFRCELHPELSIRGFRGCIAYDCQGAGQRTAQLYLGADWRTRPELAQEQFKVFTLVAQLQQMLRYLAEVVTLDSAQTLYGAAEALIAENLALTENTPETLLRADLEAYRLRVNHVLKQAAELVAQATRRGKPPRPRRDFIGHDFKAVVLDGCDLSLSLLLAARLEGCSLRGCCLLGADLRDTNIRGCDLSDCIFLTQAQLNSAQGDGQTVLPPGLLRPEHWAYNLSTAR